MNPDPTAPKAQYCLKYKLPKYTKQMRGADARLCGKMN